MSPLSLRRYRAERLLRSEFDALRGRVLASVRGRLRASGARLDQDELEACYAQAWQGLYTAVLDGQEIASPAGWLVTVTFRRAIEEQRRPIGAARAWRQTAARSGDADPYAERSSEAANAGARDLADELDDRVRLRQLFEGLRGRLEGREREAAALCYLQGFSRADAAARMGVSEARMRKLMEGRGPGRPGVAHKVGALVETIRDGGWCDEQGSLMRALAYGILDPAGERYRLAVMHRSQCPACRAYVSSLRGLAAALPPVLLPWALPVGVLAQVADGVDAGRAAGGGGRSVGGGRAVAGGGGRIGAQAGRGIGGGVLPAPRGGRRWRRGGRGLGARRRPAQREARRWLRARARRGSWLHRARSRTSAAGDASQATCRVSFGANGDRARARRVPPLRLAARRAQGSLATAVSACPQRGRSLRPHGPAASLGPSMRWRPLHVVRASSREVDRRRRDRHPPLRDRRSPVPERLAAAAHSQGASSAAAAEQEFAPG